MNISYYIDYLYSNIERDINISHGLLSGKTGMALCLVYAGYSLKNDKYYNKGLGFLENTLVNIDNFLTEPTLCEGLAGLGWCFNHLKQQNILDSDDLLLVELDEYLYYAMVKFIENNNYDFLHGGIGIAFYFLKRYQVTNDTKLKNKYIEYLLVFLRILKDKSHKTESNGVFWVNDFMSKNQKESVIDLGLAHGMASIINFLSRLAKVNYFRKEVLFLLNQSLNYMIDIQCFDMTKKSQFPTVVIKGREMEFNSRLAWCYGDLGISLSLYHAAKVTNRIDVFKVINEVMYHLSERTLDSSTLVKDYSICHGAIGNYLIFKYLSDNNYGCGKSVDFWFCDATNKIEILLDLDQRMDFSILNGMSGFCLSLLERKDKKNRFWNECLLIN